MSLLLSSCSSIIYLNKNRRSIAGKIGNTTLISCSDSLKKFISKEERDETKEWLLKWHDSIISENDDLNRIGRDNIKIIKTKDKITSLRITLPNGKYHKIKLDIAGFYVVDNIDEDLIWAVGFHLMPTKLIEKVKRVSFNDLQGTLGGVHPMRPKRVLIDRDKFISETFAHELGHVTHNHIKRFRHNWKKAIKDDNIDNVSGYASTSYKEDFAETLVAYLEPNDTIRESYRVKYPNRFSMIDQIMNKELKEGWNSQMVLFDSYVVSIPSYSLLGIAMVLYLTTHKSEEVQAP